MERDLHYTRDEVSEMHKRAAKVIGDNATRRVLSDLLTLHDANASLREHADRMREVLLALADACDRVDDDSTPDEGANPWIAIVALDNALVACGSLDDDGRTWLNTARALRTLAGEASR